MRALTTGEHKTLNLQSDLEILLAHRIDNLEHALSLKQGCYSPHLISVSNHQLTAEVEELTERIAELESALAAATVVPVEVVEAARSLSESRKKLDDICNSHNTPCRIREVSNYILSLAAKGKGGA